MKRNRLLIAFTPFVSLLLVAQPFVLPQNADTVKALYTKYEFMIPMRDGVRLFTIVYTPKDKSKSYPFLLTRTPYGVGPYGVDNYRASLGPSDHFDKEGFIFVDQDARGASPPSVPTCWFIKLKP